MTIHQATATRTTDLLARDAQALKAADSLCFDYDDGMGRPRIRAIIRGEDYRHEQTISIPVETQRVTDYSGHNGAVSAFAMAMHSQHNANVRTMLRHCRAGSRLSFVWTRDNSSPVTRDAGIVVDSLDVVVQNGSVADTFRIETFIGLDNSARMVKRERY